MMDTQTLWRRPTPIDPASHGLLTAAAIRAQFGWSEAAWHARGALAFPSGHQQTTDNTIAGGEVVATWLWRADLVAQWAAKVHSIAVVAAIPLGGSFMALTDVLELLRWTDAQLQTAQSLGFPTLYIRRAELYGPADRVVLRHEIERWLGCLQLVALSPTGRAA